MKSFHIEICLCLATLSILSQSVSSQYGSGKPSSTYGAPGLPQGGGGGYPGNPPPPPSGGKPSSPSGGGGQEGSEPEPFSFNYQVKDDQTGTEFSHKADSDGKTVQGVYDVKLPDGRKQIVTYTADESGYKADVKYEGEAIPGPSGPAPQPGRPPVSGGGAPRPGPGPAPRPQPGPAPGAPSGGGYGGAPPPRPAPGPAPAAPSGGGGYGAPPSAGGSNGNFPAGYPSGGGGGPVKGSGGFGGYRK